MADRAKDADRMPHIIEALEHVDQGVTIFDHNLRLVACNRKFLQLYSCPEDMSLPGTEFASFIAHNARRGEYGPGDPDEQVRERVSLARRFQKYRIQRTRPDGSTMEIAGSPLPGGGFVITYTDVSHLIRPREMLRQKIAATAAELKLSEARLRLIADEVPAGIAHIDHNMNILYANKRFAGSYRREPSEVIGMNAHDLLHPRTMEESSKYFEQARRGALVDFEMRIELPGDRIKDIRTLLRPERPSSGEVIGFYLLSIDVTRRKATASALMRSHKMDALGRMASGISHDFNNLLTIILGNLGPLAEQIDDRALIEGFLAPAIAAARRGSSLTGRLLALARREQFDPEPTDISEAVREICNLLVSSLPSALALIRNQSDDLPLALVDQAQLEMALLNLALNARDATEGRGTITVTTRRHTLQPDEAAYFHMRAGDYVRIDFADDGCGMSPELAEKIFEPFVTSKAAGSGSGLGLAMVYGFVRQSNGAIWVDSAPGKGTTFSILLPEAGIAPGIAVDAPPESTAKPEAPGSAEQRPRLVLLVEDDRDVRRIFRHQISRLGHHLVEATNADEALNLVSQIEGIDIVVSDIDMPGTMDGVGLATRLRQSEGQPPIVLMSGSARFANSGTGLPGVPFLTKPFTVEQLRFALDTASASPVDKDLQH